MWIPGGWCEGQGGSDEEVIGWEFHLPQYTNVSLLMLVIVGNRDWSWRHQNMKNSTVLPNFVNGDFVYM